MKLGGCNSLLLSRAEEQKQNHVLQAQRLALEAEVAAFRRAHEAGASSQGLSA